MIRKRRVIAAAVVITVTTVVACLGPALSTTEQENIVVNVGSAFDFGAVPIGMARNTMIVVSPASTMMNSSDTIGSGRITPTTCGPFSLQLDPLPATIVQTCSGSGSGSTGTAASAVQPSVPATECTQTSYKFQATYQPTLAITSSCTITVVGSNNTLVFDLKGTGTAPAKALDAQPSTINIGQVPLGGTGSQKLSLHNAGSTPLQVMSLTASAPFTTDFTPVTIPVNGTDDVNVTCSPVAPAGSHMSNLVITSEAGTAMVLAKCDGVQTNLSSIPSPLDVTTRVNENKSATVMITSNNVPTMINSVTIVPTVTGVPITITAGNTGSHNLGSGASESFTIKYAPTMAQMPGELAKLHIDHVGGTRDISINGAALETVLSIDPDTVDFGPVCQNMTAAKDVGITTGAPGPIHLDDPMGADLPKSPFAFKAKAGTAPPYDMKGNAGTMLAFTATVMPTTQTGPIADRVVLRSDMPGNTQRDLNLKAEVLPAGAGAAPSTLDFGGILKNTTSTAIMTTLRNCGTTPVDITASISGANAADFSIVIPSSVTQTLGPNETVQFGVVMRADKPGAKIASLDFASAGGTASVALIGTALGAGDGTDEEGGPTYYTCRNCSSGGGAGVWAAVVYLGLRRRRRKK